ncbi:ComEC/Rec2 family competence protein [Candidatus Parcubacteria bacterium]|nr:ComEC/Rec2 family competence protein [Candidatus Parcubacteria bacterium]
MYFFYRGRTIGITYPQLEPRIHKKPSAISGAGTEFAISQSPVRKLNDAPGKIALIGQISDEPDVRNSFQKLKVKIGSSIVLASTDLYPVYHYLDAVQITGKLKTPAVFEDFNYKNYLAKDGIYSVMDYATVDLVSGQHRYNLLSFIYEKILLLKNALIHAVDLAFGPPHNSIIQGIVYGDDSKMSQEVKDKFNATGLSHVTAVSGGNVVIVISMIMMLLLALGFWRSQAFYIAFIFIWFYIALVGFPASAVRAGIMGSIAIFAQALGRQNSSWRVLVIAAAIMLLQNPMLLLYDIGFQLSFLASLGIIHAKPIIDYFFGKQKQNFLVSIMSVTISAQLFALPVIMYTFGTVSLVSLVTNVLVLPAVPFIMVLGFLSSAAGTFSHFLGWLFSLPTWLLVVYFLKILNLFSRPWAVLAVNTVSWIWLVFYYAAVSLAVIWLQKYIRSKNFL